MSHNLNASEGGKKEFFFFFLKKKKGTNVHQPDPAEMPGCYCMVLADDHGHRPAS